MNKKCEEPLSAKRHLRGLLCLSACSRSPSQVGGSQYFVVSKCSNLFFFTGLISNIHQLVGGYNPFEKYCIIKLDHFTNVAGLNIKKKIFEAHHLYQLPAAPRQQTFSAKVTIVPEVVARTTHLHSQSTEISVCHRRLKANFNAWCIWCI